MEATSRRQSRYISLLFDPSTRRFLGKGGKWVSAAELERDPPGKAEDIMPERRDEKDTRTQSGDPGPTYPCIDGEIWVCSGGSCRNLHIPCP